MGGCTELWPCGGSLCTKPQHVHANGCRVGGLPLTSPDIPSMRHIGCINKIIIQSVINHNIANKISSKILKQLKLLPS
jgi:hypothetical protein